MRTLAFPSVSQGVDPAFAAVRPMSQPLNDQTDPSTSPPQGDEGRRFEVRSVTGACYTLVEESAVDDAGGAACSRYRTAYAGLPVVANDDGSFSIVDTHTRLVRVGPRR
jgi:hypothetical protein